MCSRSLHCPFGRESEAAAIPEVTVLHLAESCFEHLKSFVLSRNVKLESGSKPISETKYIVTVGETPDLAASATGELAPCAWGSGLWFVLCTALLVGVSSGSEFPAARCCYGFSAPRWDPMGRGGPPKLLPQPLSPVEVPTSPLPSHDPH